MSLPTAIFLSSCLIALVILYGFTKDRWPWKKIALIAGGCFVLLITVAGGWLWWIDWRREKEQRERQARARKLYKVEVGDSYQRVIQQHGVPDTIVEREDSTFAIGYWDDWTANPEIEKVFGFSNDSSLSLVRFIGEGYNTIDRSWRPEDGVELGTFGDSVQARLGEPCYEEVQERATVLRFPTDQPDVTRNVRVSHGDQRVVWHGWSRGGCDD